MSENDLDNSYEALRNDSNELNLNEGKFICSLCEEMEKKQPTQDSASSLDSLYEGLRIILDMEGDHTIIAEMAMEYFDFHCKSVCLNDHEMDLFESKFALSINQLDLKLEELRSLNLDQGEPSTTTTQVHSDGGVHGVNSAGVESPGSGSINATKNNEF